MRRGDLKAYSAVFIWRRLIALSNATYLFFKANWFLETGGKKLMITHWTLQLKLAFSVIYAFSIAFRIFFADKISTY